MKTKAYIVTNEVQERYILKKLEEDGFTWWTGDSLIDNTPSKLWDTEFQYVIFVDNMVTWDMLSELKDEEVVYDGREEQ